MSNYHVISSPENLQSLLSVDLTKLSLLYFRADWAEPCVQMDLVVDQLVKRWSDVLFLSVRFLSPSVLLIWNYRANRRRHPVILD